MAEIKIGRMVMGGYQTNCYFLYRDGSTDAVVIDPGDRGANIYNALRRNGFTVRAIFLTHGHFDHIWGLDELRDAANAAAEADGQAPVLVHACEDERELLKNHFDAIGESGFDYAYRYPGMNKVLQAAGRVIRTVEDVGIIALLDERFLQFAYRKMYPREWETYETVTLETISKRVERFWDSWL